jgi:hypothetical protein
MNEAETYLTLNLAKQLTPNLQLRWHRQPDQPESGLHQRQHSGTAGSQRIRPPLQPGLTFKL